MTDAFACFAPLGIVSEALVDPPRLPSGDWRQDAAYAAPLWDETAAAIAKRVSIENIRGLYALALEPSSADVEALLRLARWSSCRTYRVGVAESSAPIEDGYLRRLRLTIDRDAPAQPVTPAELFAAFLAAERARIGHMERWLRRRYGQSPPEHDVFWWIDYPVFDSGTMGLGSALLVHGPELHCWSRVYHAHK